MNTVIHRQDRIFISKSAPTLKKLLEIRAPQVAKAKVVIKKPPKMLFKNPFPQKLALKSLAKPKLGK